MTTISLIPQQTTVLAMAQTSIAHNGESIGIDQPFHREKMMMPDGRTHEVPTITGNAMRGILRDELANFTCEVLGITELPQPQFYLLYSGGALVKEGSKGWATKKNVPKLRSLIPHLSLLGFSMGNHIAQGKVKIGKFIPLAKETAHFVPEGMRRLCNRSFYDMMQIEAYTRMDDAKRETYAGIIKQGATFSDDVNEASQQMRFQIETICAGAHFWWSYSLKMASALEQTAFYCALGLWARDPRIGGVGRWGHGLLELDFGDGVVLNSGNNPFEDAITQYQSHLLEWKDRIIEILTYGL